MWHAYLGIEDTGALLGKEAHSTGLRLEPGCQRVSAGSQMSKAMKSRYHEGPTLFCNRLSEAGCQKSLGKKTSTCSYSSYEVGVNNFPLLCVKMTGENTLPGQSGIPLLFPSLPCSPLHLHLIFSLVNASEGKKRELNAP